MKDFCFYCKVEKDVEYFAHPLTHQVKPTCGDCKKKLLSTRSYGKERSLLSKTGFFGVTLLVISIIVAIFANTAVGVWGIILSVTIATASYLMLEYFVRKRDKIFGFDPSKYFWCKTCSNFKTVKNWDLKFSTVIELPDTDKVPCEIFDITREIWIGYFNLPLGERKLYPENCRYWKGR